MLEYILRSALATTPFGLSEPELLEIESGRCEEGSFTGDVMSIDLTWSAHGSQWCCTAQVTTDVGQVASFRLLFAPAAA